MGRARIPFAITALIAGGYAVALAGDWLSLGGDPQSSGWQRHGKALTVANVRNLKLLWKRQLEAPLPEARRLSAPVIIGPTITHRGVRELIFIADSRDNLYAVDADLGTLFWKRHFATDAARACAPLAQPPTPVIEPDPDEDFSGEPVTDDEDDDEAGGMRPLYAVDSGGRLHILRVSDGADASAPVGFLPPKENYSSLNFWSGRVYAGVRNECNNARHGVWWLDVRRPGAKPLFSPAKEDQRIIVSPTGKVYGAAGDEIAINYHDHQLIARSTRDRRLLLLGFENLVTVAEYRDSRDEFLGLATWQDAAGVRWIYAATLHDIKGFQLTGPPGNLKLELAWTSDNLSGPGTPVVTNGVVMVLAAGPANDTLMALDAATGRILYSSEPIRPHTSPSSLAVANGHICFGSLDNALSCYGTPMER